jgi:hypothetical protein
MKPNTLFQVRFRPSVTPPRGWTHSAHYNVLNYDRHHDKYLIGKTWLPAKDFIKIEVQDAPVFDKPVLRTIKSLKENECIEIPNDTIRDLVLEQAEREGLKVGVGVLKPSEWMEFDNGINYLYYQKNGLWKSSSPTFNNHTILPASKFVEVPQEKQEPITEHQKDECKTADERIKELERICELRLQDNDGLADECDKWKTMLTATNQHIDKLRDICQIASSTGSKEIMQSVLKSIATGEI